MNSNSQPPGQVPTLTEVVTWPESTQLPVAPVTSAEAQPMEDAGAVAVASPPSPALPSEEQLVERVLAELQRQVDLMLDYRLREMLVSLLTRATDNLVREARGELASTLRDIVSRAVAQELARHRTR